MKLSPKLNLPIPEGSDIHNLVNFVALLNAIDNNAAPLGTMTDHINSKNNPHAVTKEQLGLGQVNNVPQYSKTEIDSKLAELSKASQLPADSIPPTSTPASYPTGVTVMTVTTGYPGATTNSPKTVMTVRGSVDRGSYQLLIGSGDTAPQNRIYDGTMWGAWFTIATTLSNVASATKLANARQIGGVSFDGTSDITLPGVNAPGNQPTSGKAATAGRADEATHADNATTANKLATARKIGGVTFDGTADIALPGVNTVGNQDTTGKAATAGRADSSGTADAANKLTTARKIGGVSFDGSADVSLPGVNIAGNQDTSGNARTAARLQTARNINGVGFDGSSDITIDPALRTISIATDLFTLPSGFYFNTGAASPNKPAGAGDWFIVEVMQTSMNGSMRLVDHNGLSFWVTKSAGTWGPWHQDADDNTVVHNSGNETIGGSKSFSDVLTALSGIKGDITGSLKGNADTATKLATARKIGGVSFDGSADIALPGVNTAGNQDTSGQAATAKAIQPIDLSTLGADINLDNIIVPGWYISRANLSSVTGTKIPAGPIFNKRFLLKVTVDTAGFIYQEFMLNGATIINDISTNLLTRRCSFGYWQAPMATISFNTDSANSLSLQGINVNVITPTGGAGGSIDVRAGGTSNVKLSVKQGGLYGTNSNGNEINLLTPPRPTNVAVTAASQVDGTNKIKIYVAGNLLIVNFVGVVFTGGTTPQLTLDVAVAPRSVANSSVAILTGPGGATASIILTTGPNIMTKYLDFNLSTSTSTPLTGQMCVPLAGFDGQVFN